MFSPEEITEVIKMLTEEDLDIRSVTLSMNMLDAIDREEERSVSRIMDRVEVVQRFSQVVDEVKEKYGVSIITKRVATSPVQFFLEANPSKGYAIKLGKA